MTKEEQKLVTWHIAWLGAYARCDLLKPVEGSGKIEKTTWLFSSFVPETNVGWGMLMRDEVSHKSLKMLNDVKN